MHVSRVTDPFGNQMVFTYARLPDGVTAPTLLGTGTPVIDGEFAYSHVPESISFGGDADETVVFGWGNRHDVQSSGRSGRLRILPGRLGAIETFVGDDSYSRYEVEYMDQTGAGCAGEDFTPLGQWDLPTSSLVKRIWRVGVSGVGGAGSGWALGTGDYRELRCVENDNIQSEWTLSEVFSVSEDWGSNDEGAVPTGNHSRASVVSFDGDPWPDLLAIDVDCTGIEEDRPDTCGSVGIRFQRGSASGLEADVYAHEIDLIDDALTDAFLDDGGAWAFVDIDRNGTTDLLTAARNEDPTGHMHGLEADDTELHPALALDDYPTGAENADRFLRFGQFADVDGDGFVDLVLPMNALLDRDDAQEYAAMGSGAGWSEGSTHWIRNSGSAPFLDSDDIQPLNIAFEDTITSGDGAFSLGLLSDAYDACPEPPSYQVEGTWDWYDPPLLNQPPETYYAADWQWQQTWAKWGDYNGDGVADVAYGVHACWWNTGETFGELGTLDSEIYTADGLVSVTYFGDGRGYFEDSLTPFSVGFDDVELGAECNGMTIPDSACLPFEENCETELQGCSITATAVDGLAVLDVDRSGQPDAILASAEYEGYSSTTESDAGDELEVFRSGGATRGFSIAAGSVGGSWLYRDDPLAVNYLDNYPSEEDRILADFNGDGFVDVLVVQDAVSPEREGLWLNSRTTALNRVTKIHDAYGGEIGLSYTTSTLKGDNPDLGWPVEVIDEVRDAAGTTEFTFEGGIFWGAEARFMGFRDAFIEHEDGSTSNLRYIVQPWGAGELALQTDRRTDGSIELLTYYSFWQIQVIESVEVANIDTQPPYYNAAREKCTIYADYPGTTSPYLFASEINLIEDCDAAGAQGLVDYEIQFVVNGWTGDEDYDLATWNPSQGDFPGWSFDEVIATYETTGSSSWNDASGPDHSYTSTRDYPDLLSNWPTDLAQPNLPDAPDRETTTPTNDLRRETWFYYGNRTLANHYDYGDHGTTVDDVKTQYLRDPWEIAKMGAPVYGTQLWQGTTLLQEYSYTLDENSFDTPIEVHQTGPNGGRDWTYTYENGDLASEVDPDGVGNTYERNACGLVVERTDSAGRDETFTYDNTCRRTLREWEGATTEWTYDEMGRVERTLTQPNAGDNLTTWEFREDDTLDIRNEVDLPDLTTVRGDSTLTETYLDVWGREIRTRTCSVSGAATLAAGGTAADCDAAEDATQTFTGYAEDGSLRARTGLYAQGENTPTTWTFADERGRSETVLSPAHIEGEEQWVTTTTSYRPGLVEVEGPTGRECSVTYDGAGRDWECESVSRGAEDLDWAGRVVREFDGRNIRWNTTYDGYGRVTDRRLNAAVTVFGGAQTYGQTIATYTPGDRLLTSEDALGNITKREYDEAGRLEFVKYDPTGSETIRTVESYVYGEIGTGPVFPVVTTTDVNQNVTYSTYDGLGRWLGSIYPDGSTATAEYGTNGQVATSTDRLGAATTFAYDAHGRVKTTTNAASAVTAFEYDSAGRLLSTEDADGVRQEWTYAWSGLPLYRVEGGKDVESFVYRDDGLVESHTTNGVYTEFDYDSLGRRTGACIGAPYASCDSSDGQQYAWVYDGADRVEKFRRRNGGSSWLDTVPTYNNLNWRTGVSHPSNATESWAYDKIGNLKRHTDESGVQRNWNYDGWNRVTSESIPGLSGSRTFAYTFGTTTDERFKTVMTEPGGAEHTSWTDFEGKLLDAENPFGDTSHVAYDGPLAIRRWETDGTSELNWGYWYDQLGQMVARAGPMDETTWDSWAESTTPPDPNASGPYGFEYSYSDAGRLLTRVGANDEQTTWTWGDGRLQFEEVGTTSDDDAIASIEWAYDAWGRPAARGSASSRYTGWDRDDLGRVTLTETHEGSADVVYVERSDFDAYGTAKSVVRTVGSTEESAYLYETDVRGRVTEVAAYANGSLLDTVTYGIGADGNIDTVATSAGTVTYVRNNTSRLITSVKQGSVTRGGVTTRDADGRITAAWSATSGASVLIQRDYDLLGRVSEVRTRDAANNWEDREIDRDWSGRVTEVVRAWNNTPEERVEYLYTTEGWLENETRSSWVSSAWDVDSERVHGYDDAGNRLTTHVDSTLVHEWTYRAGNQLDEDDGNAADWNLHGEIEGIAGGYEIGRNADGSEAFVGDGASVSYAITRDPYGDPLATDDGTDVLSQVWGNPELDLPLVTWDAGGNAHAVVGIEGLLVGRANEGGSWTAAASDHLGSVVLDGTTWMDVPEAFGEGAEASWSDTSRHVYAGLEALPGLPLQLSRARLYDPTVGRFTSVDPIGLRGGDHRFVYANSEPTSFVDPGGLLASSTGMWEPGGDGPASRPGSDLEGIQNARGPISLHGNDWVSDPDDTHADGPAGDDPGDADPAKTEVDPKKPPPGGYNRDGTENAEYNGDNGKSMFEFFANSDRPTNGEDGGNPADPDDKPAPAGIGGSTNGAGELAKPSPFRVYSADGVPISEKRERQFDRRLKRMSRKDGPKGNTADRVRDGSVRIYDTSHLVVRETPTGPVYEIPGTNGARTTQGDPIAVGWYIPGSDIVAIDLEKMKKDPFGMEKTVVHEVNHAVNGDDPTGRAEQFDVEARAAWVADVADSPESGVGADGRTDRERDAVAKVLAGYEDLASAFATDLAFQAYVNGWRIDRNDNLDNSAPEAK